jgi:hypothetical protein
MNGIGTTIAVAVAVLGTPVVGQVAAGGVLSNDTIVVAGLVGVSAWFVRRELTEFRAKLHKHADVLTMHALEIDRLKRPFRKSDPPPLAAREAHDGKPETDEA